MITYPTDKLLEGLREAMQTLNGDEHEKVCAILDELSVLTIHVKNKRVKRVLNQGFARMSKQIRSRTCKPRTTQR